MGNNPISMIDPDGGIPTPYEAALMANNIYNGKTKLLGGWKVSSITRFNKDEMSGLKAKLYERKYKNGRVEYAYVYAGTEDLKIDGKEDLLQIIGNSKQYSQALDVALDIDVEIGHNEVTFIGHSLGGGLANYSSIATGRSSITFNPAWVSNESLKKLYSKVDSRLPGIRPQFLQNNYIHDADPLHAFQTNSKLAKMFLKQIGKNHFIDGGFFSNYLTGHLMNTMISRMERQGGSVRIDVMLSPRYF